MSARREDDATENNEAAEAAEEAQTEEAQTEEAQTEESPEEEAAEEVGGDEPAFEPVGDEGATAEDPAPSVLWAAKRNLGYLGLNPARYDLTGLALKVAEEKPHTLRQFAAIAKNFKA